MTPQIAEAVTVLIQNTGTVDGACTGLIVKDSAGNTVDAVTYAAGSEPALSAGVLNSVTGSLTDALDTGSYTVTVTTAAGGSSFHQASP